MLARPRGRVRGGAILLLLAVASIAAATLAPSGGPHDVRLRPLGDVDTAGAAANVLLFAPLGVALSLLRWRFRAAAAAAVAVSVAIEVAQLVVPGRTSSVDDVIMNALGAVAGWVVAAYLLRDRR